MLPSSILSLRLLKAVTCGHGDWRRGKRKQPSSALALKCLGWKVTHDMLIGEDGARGPKQRRLGNEELMDICWALAALCPKFCFKLLRTEFILCYSVLHTVPCSRSQSDVFLPNNKSKIHSFKIEGTDTKCDVLEAG